MNKKVFAMFIFICIGITSFAQIKIEHNGTLKELLNTLNNRYGYKFMYSNSDINDTQKIRISTNNSSLENLLKEVSKTVSISYTIINKQVVLKPKEKKVEPIVVKKEDVKPTPKQKEEAKIEEIQETLKPEKIQEKVEIEKKTDSSEIQVLEKDTLKKTETEFEKQDTVLIEETVVVKETPSEEIKKEETNFLSSDELKKKYNSKKNITSEFALHSNLLYYLALTPNLGAEYTIQEKYSIILSGLWSHIDWDKGNKTYRIWAITPELRYYFNDNLYAGAMFHIGELNFKLGEKGYQGDFIGAGLTFGYLLNLNDNFKLDFGIAYGYTNYKYDSYEFVKEVNTIKGSGNKNLWVPTKLGVTLVWKIK